VGEINHDLIGSYASDLNPVDEKGDCVTKEPRRVKQTVALSVMADLLLLRMRYPDIPAQGLWSAFTLKRNCAWEIMQQ